MQNRNMYLYRRQGPNKKRTKPGSPKKNRGPQKGLPNSVRDLLPLIQPATKALAQMLAGRVGASGQLGHARAVLAQTEKLVSDRAHNRLNPAEREEFFEQVARLKLTLADAESEAEFQATEEDVPASAPTPVNRERLKELAMALTSSGGPTSYDDRHKAGAANSEESEETEPLEEPLDSPEEPAAESVKTGPPDDPNQLRLPRSSAEPLKVQPDMTRARTNGRRRIAKPEGVPAKKPALKPAPKPIQAAEATAPAAPKAETSAPRNSTPGPKVPKGWIIDDEGFVVPGPAA